MVGNCISSNRKIILSRLPSKCHIIDFIEISYFLPAMSTDMYILYYSNIWFDNGNNQSIKA